MPTNTDAINFFLSFDRKAFDLFLIKEIIPRHLSDVRFSITEERLIKASLLSPFMINTKQIKESIILLFP
ncbi:hypothetical protein D931_03523 [Enterococcus faecium 13.SD.W.09]|nr:hypothetical protein D931_03523 [Enterococcus faecium 13.SD.W.09]